MIKGRLEALYAKLPPIPPCKEGCDDCCSQVPMLPFEAERLGLDYCATPSTDGKCDLFKDGKCSVYEDRPFICRLFNATSEDCYLTCLVIKDHGLMPFADAEALLAEYFEILELHSPEEKERFELAWKESRPILENNSKSNGWY